MVAILQATPSGGGGTTTFYGRDHVPTPVSDGAPVDPFLDVSGRSIVAQKVERGIQASVTGTSGDTVLLPANNARLGATIFNDSSEMLYILLADTACTTDVYTTSVLSEGYYEVPYGYVGVVKGTWSAPNGFARVTELT